MQETPLEKTVGYQVAIGFKPFIDPKCREHMKIVKDMAKTINRAINLEDRASKLREAIYVVKAFEQGNKVRLNGYYYDKDINAHSFYEAIDKLANLK